MRRLPIVLSLLLTFARADVDGDDDAMLKDIEGVGQTATELAGKVARKFAFVFFSTHEGDVSSFFAHYNRFKDGAVQTLGPQELRELLKDLDVGPYALRGEYASALTAALDADLDGRLSELELQRAIALTTCFIEGTEAPLAKLEDVRALAQAATNVDGLLALLAELRRCKPLKDFWDLHRNRAAKVEAKAINALGLEASSPAKCAAAVAEPVQRATRGSGGAGTGALRRLLKAEGVEPLLLRHLVSLGLVLALDADKPSDGRLNDEELRSFAQPLCDPLYTTMRRLKTSAVAAIEASLFDPKWDAATFLRTLHNMDDAGVHAQAKSALTSGIRCVGDAMAIVIAYLSLAPRDALVDTQKDEL